MWLWIVCDGGPPPPVLRRPCKYIETTLKGSVPKGLSVMVGVDSTLCSFFIRSVRMMISFVMYAYTKEQSIKINKLLPLIFTYRYCLAFGDVPESLSFYVCRENLRLIRLCLVLSRFFSHYSICQIQT